jgi:hypothetical protein
LPTAASLNTWIFSRGSSGRRMTSRLFGGGATWPGRLLLGLALGWTCVAAAQPLPPAPETHTVPVPPAAVPPAAVQANMGPTVVYPAQNPDTLPPERGPAWPRGQFAPTEQAYPWVVVGGVWGYWDAWHRFHRRADVLSGRDRAGRPLVALPSRVAVRPVRAAAPPLGIGANRAHGR